jgi:hypothetical protein
MPKTSTRMFGEFFKHPENRIILIILVIGLVHGLIYVFVVPPWQHYDEPAHFEYAWIKAHHPGEPVADNIDQGLRDRILSSMVETHFFNKIYGSPGNDPNFQPIWMFISQASDPPFYHLIAGIPIRLFPNAEVLTLMYLMRLISTGFLLISIWAAWGAAKELAPPGHFLRWAIPLFLALLPGFIDIMTAINNDAAAIAFSSIFFWFSLRLIRRRLNLFDLFVLIIITVLAFYTKKNIWTILIFLPVVVFIAAFPVKLRKWAGIFIAFMLIISSFALFSWGDAAYWYRMTPQSDHTRVELQSSTESPEYAIQIEMVPGETKSPSLWQHLPIDDNEGINGKTVTVGGWVWASQPAHIASPGLMYITNTERSKVMHQEIAVGLTPIFVTTEVEIPDNAYRILVTLSPQVESIENPTTVYYTGLFLIEGTCPIIANPKFSDLSENEGLWCGQKKTNLIRNGNGVLSGLAVRSSVYQLVRRIGPYNEIAIVSVLGYLTDPQGSTWYNWLAGKTLFKTFWACFSWGQVYLTDPWAYRVLVAITLLLLMGSAVFLLRGEWRKSANTTQLIIYSFIFGISGWIIAFIAGMFFGGLLLKLVYPVARYAFPVIIPTSFFLCAGWMEWFGWLGKFWKQHNLASRILFVVFLVLLDIYALYSLEIYYWS